MSATQQTLAQMIRAKHPGSYDDMDDVTLEKSVLAKYPQYSDLPQTAKKQTPTPRGWMDSVKDFASETWKQINPVSAVEGINQTIRHPIDTFHSLNKAQDEVAQKAEDAFKKGDYGTGVGHVLNWLLPIIGPQSDEAGEMINRGEIAKGLGKSVGLGLNLAAPELVKKIPTSLPASMAGKAGEMYQSALKPSTTLSTKEVGNIVKTGLENEIPVSASGLEKIKDLVTDLNGKIQAQIQSGSNAGATVNKFKVASRLGGTAKKFATQVNPEADLKAVASSGNEFLANQPNEIPASSAQAIKSGTYQQIGSKAYGELSSAAKESQKALARGIKEELQSQFPEIKGLNAREGQLLGLNEALERAVKRIDNHQLMGIGTPIAAGAGGAITGSPIGAVIAGVLKKVLDDPIVKSKLAIAINKGAKGTGTLGAAQTRLAGYSNALGNAASAAGRADQNNE